MVECSFCGEEFESERALHLHWGEEHEDELNSHKKEKLKKAERKEEEERNKKRENRKNLAFKGLAAILGLAVIGLVVPQLINSTTSKPEPTGTAANLSLEGQPMLGSPNASVTVVEFGDYRCPYCARFEQATLPKLKNQYIESGKIKFYFVNFAFLDQGFPGRTSHRAARAAECVYERDRESFWKYHKAIYENQGRERSDWATLELLGNLADKHTNLTAAKLRQCVTSGETSDEVSGDKVMGRRNGVSSTPTIIVNGEKIRGNSFDVLKAAIEQELR